MLIVEGYRFKAVKVKASMPYENVSSENHNFDVKLCMQKCENTEETLPESKLW